MTAAANDIATSLHRRITAQLANSGSPLAGKPVLILCSGGIDSIALVSLLTSLPNKGTRPSSIHVLHLDHGYRTGQVEQLAEAEAVRVVCERHDLPLTIIARDPAEAALAASSSDSKQADARTWRYAQATALAKSLGIHYIMTGHTASDQVENALLHLVGAHQSPGMTVSTLWTDAAPYKLTFIRPLLSITRGDLEAYMDDLGLIWGEDPSNAEIGSYARNKIRHDIVPELLGAHPDAGVIIARNAERAQDQHLVISELSTALLATIKINVHALDRARLKELSLPTRQAVIAAWLHELFPDNRSFNHRVVKSIAELVTKPTGKIVYVNSDNKITTTRERLYLV